MSDFISNDPNGKSDLYTRRSGDQPPHEDPSHEAPTDTSSATENRTTEGSAFQSATSEGKGYAGNGAYSGQSSYQNSYGTGYQPPYGSYGYGYPPPAPSHPNGFSTAALVLGIVTWAGFILCCGCFSPITAILSIIFACMGRTYGKFEGRALVGMIMSIVFLVLFLMIILFFMVIVAFGIMESPDVYEEGIDQISLMLRG